MNQSKEIVVVVVVCVVVLLLINHSGEWVAERTLETLPLKHSQVRRKLEVSANSIGKRDFSSAIDQLKEVLSLIKHRYELEGKQGSQFFRTANNIGPQAWDTLKLNFA
eukprot:gene52705-64403_t